MSSVVNPYITNCSFCNDGRLRFQRCSSCDTIVALCDECRLMWEDIEQVNHDPNGASDSTYPQCPSCGDKQAAWATVPIEEIDESNLRRFCAGDSI